MTLFVFELKKHPSKNPACFCESTLNARVAFSGVFLRIVAGFGFSVILFISLFQSRIHQQPARNELMP